MQLDGLQDSTVQHACNTLMSIPQNAHSQPLQPWTRRRVKASVVIGLLGLALSLISIVFMKLLQPRLRMQPHLKLPSCLFWLC
jgi:hypothetical protein